MLTIGFTNHYYTLWSVFTSERYDSNTGAMYQRTTFQYRQNLSMDFDAAKAKVEAMSDTYEIDLDLRGENGRFYYTERMIRDMDLYRFTFGKLAGMDMRTCIDTWQLNRAMNEEPNPRRRVWARNRLIEIGYLVKYSWIDTRADWYELSEAEQLANAAAIGVSIEEWRMNNSTMRYAAVQIRRKYCPIRKYEYLKKKEAEEAASGHFFSPGERVELEVLELRSTSYETQFGTCFIQILQAVDGRVFKYRGSSPLHIGKTETWKIKATIEHGEYNGVKETRLKRPKKVG